MKSNKKCEDLAKEIKKLGSEISEREGASNVGITLVVPVPDETTEKNQEKLQDLKNEYNLNCK
jgi:hypothetical protein